MNVKEIITGPLSLLYGAGVATRNHLFDWRLLPSRRFDVTLVCVGNITVGGTGKTPHVEALVAALENDYRVACLSRGYKRETRGFLLVQARAAASQVGDEPAQVKNKFPEITVAVDGNRARGIERLLQLPSPPEIIIMDDGFQHRHVHPDVNILLVDYRRPLHDDHLLPRGRLREPASATRRAHFIIVTKCPSDISRQEQQEITDRLAPGNGQNVLFTSMTHGPVTPLDGVSPCLLSPATTVLGLTGIASPAPFLHHLETFAGRVVPVTFPDHHPFSPRDTRRLARLLDSYRPACIFTTEKDATRLASIPLPPVVTSNTFYIPAIPRFITPPGQLLQTISDYARQNKRN